MNSIATITDVREIGIEGEADPAPWRPILEPLGLIAAVSDERVPVHCNTLSARWMGVRFREAIVVVEVFADRGGERTRAVFLDFAFQSSRLFACIERHRFRTGFQHAVIESRIAGAEGFSVRSGGEPILTASVAPGARSRERDDLVWEQPIYLPSRRSALRGLRDVFHARISGDSLVFPFDPDSDRFEHAPGDRHPALSRLAEGGFRPLRWRTRAASTHSRSGTEREDVPSDPAPGPAYP
ncbi:MAG: hypothetical protein H6813_02000 [Phycisphaeraceae bacterium]|nr:hypothetical protein [Phycisphaeraceae bacterium]